MKAVRLVTVLLTVAVVLSGKALAQPGGEIKDYLWQGNLEIPDFTPGEFVGATITVPDDATLIADVDVDVVIQHTWQGDLIIELERSGGPRVPLIFRAGDSDGGGAGFSANNFGDPAVPDSAFIFDDEADAAYDSDLGWGTVPDPGVGNVGGSWIPYGEFESGGIATLGAFDGLRKGGDWTLWVSDNADGDVGELLQFSLHITNVPEPLCSSLLGLVGLTFFRRRR